MLHLLLSVKAAAALIGVLPTRKRYTFTELRTMAKPARGICYTNNHTLNHLSGRMPF